MRREAFVVLLLAAILLATPAVWAGDGHTLHGVGAVNSSMGGAGVALPIDTIGGLLLNPALAVGQDGSHFAFSAEYNEPKNAVESTVTVPTPGGPLKISGRTDEAGDRALIPAFGFIHHTRGSNFAYGIGFLGLAGFGADYPQNSTNPIQAPQPQGFGLIYSNYQLLKVPTVLAWQINDSFSFGLSLNAAYATLTANPAGFANPDCSSPTGPCLVPSVNADSSWGYGAGIGIRYKFTPTLALGASYNTKTKFQEFSWNTVIANPQLATFGTGRKVRLQLDMPAVTIVGLGWTPSDRLSVALDEKLIDYEKTAGFSDVLGFKNIKVTELGLQYKLTDAFTLRGGYNKSQNPIPADRTFFTVETPAIFKTHYCGGIGFKVSDILTLDAAYYHVQENSITGPIFGPTGPIPGASVTTRMAMDSVVVTFNFGLAQ